MGHPLRWFMPGIVYETTIRTIQERFLIRPGGACRELVLGVLGRGQMLYPTVRLHAFVYLSNHAHLLVSADHGDELAAFLGFVNGNVARELGRLHGWRGPFWGRRHRPIPILDDEALVARLRYVMSQGVKEGLVATPIDWPGASAIPGLVGEMRLEGVWYDRTLETRARRRGGPVDPSAFAHAYPVRLTPIPPFAHLTEAELACVHRELVRGITLEAPVDRAPLGPYAVQREDPHAAPHTISKSPAPTCHTSSASLWRRFRSDLRAFTDQFRAVAALVRKLGSLTTVAFPFPAGSFPPRLAYVRNPRRPMGAAHSGPRLASPVRPSDG